MARVGARGLLLVLVASWFAPAALATYASPEHSCCRRAGHHCQPSAEKTFRDAKLHCHNCQGLVSAHQAPRVHTAFTAIAPNDEHRFVREFSSANRSTPEPKEETGRAPPTVSSR
ncbi:MAG: hypothetical protein LAN37_11420 [Acidobacteriia bacterium]|nr:hypothetical protein [Terriglobia bacterium]